MGLVAGAKGVSMWIESNVANMFLRDITRTQDQGAIDEVFHQDVYGIRQLDHGRMERIVDVGAHLGAFTKTITTLNPKVEVIAVEPHPALYEQLILNLQWIDSFVLPIQAAMHYYQELLVLHSRVYEGTPSTGGSFITSGFNAQIHRSGHQELIPVDATTLEAVLAHRNWDGIDLLKLDCEGSEFSILKNADLSKVKIIVGEWHHRSSMMELVARKFRGWEFVILKDEHLGIFQLHNKDF